MASKNFNHYVLGFAFDDIGRVALIRKNKPDWQRGRWNGVGGKVEPKELAVVAMSREFFEETGVMVPSTAWHRRGEMLGDGWIVHVFRFAGSRVRAARTMEAEPITLWPVNGLEGLTCIENVPALIALCQIPESQPSGVSPTFILTY